MALVLALLLAPGVVLTFVRLVEPVGGRWVRLEAFTPLGARAVRRRPARACSSGSPSRRRWRRRAIARRGGRRRARRCTSWWFAPHGRRAPTRRRAQGAEPLRVMTANVYRGPRPTASTWCRRRARRTSTCWWSRRSPGGAGRDGERPGSTSLLPVPGGRARTERGRGRWSSRRPARRGRPGSTRPAGGWQVPMGEPDRCSPSTRSRPPTSRRGGATTTRSGRGRGRRAAGPGRRRPQRHPRPRRRCARLADAGYRSVAELANEGWQPDLAGARRGRRARDLAARASSQIDHVLVGPAVRRARQPHRRGPRDRPPCPRRGGGGEVTGAARPHAGARSPRTRSSSRCYGPWEPLDPAGAREFMAGFDRPWWIVGGWAIEAFTGVPASTRTSTSRSWPATSRRCASTSATAGTSWSNDGGTLRPLDDRFPERARRREPDLGPRRAPRARG